MKPILETSVDDVRGPLEFSVLGAVAAVTTVVQPMLERGSGTILFTTGGAAINPYPLRAGVGISFAAEVAYARMLHDELADRGIHVGHTAIAGRIAPGEAHEPEDIADVLWKPPHRAQHLPGPDRDRLTRGLPRTPVAGSPARRRAGSCGPELLASWRGQESQLPRDDPLAIALRQRGTPAGFAKPGQPDASNASASRRSEAELTLNSARGSVTGTTSGPRAATTARAGATASPAAAASGCRQNGP